MKRYTLILIASFIVSFAFAGNSKLNLSLWNNSNFTVVLDGQIYHSTNLFLLENLAPGYHDLVVRKRVHPHYNSATKIIYRGTVHIPHNSKVIAKVGKYNTLDILRVEKNHYVKKAKTACCVNGCNHHVGYGMNRHAFDKTLRSISYMGFDSDKLRRIKKAIRNYGVSSEQVKIFMENLSFESARLKLAKWAHPYTLDKENYYVTHSVFAYRGSVKSLNRYLRGAYHY